MTNLFRVRVGLTGFIGAPGVATFYFLDVATAHDALHALWTEWATHMPTDVHIQVLAGADTIDDVTGNLTGSVPTAQPAEIVGADVGRYAAPTGVLVQWFTSTIVDKHRLRGRTFIVPSANTIFGTDGQLLADQRGNLEVSSNAFLVAQSSSFVIWHRPRKARAATATRPALAAHDGSHALVTSIGVSTKAVVLRSRRD